VSSRWLLTGAAERGGARGLKPPLSPPRKGLAPPSKLAQYPMVFLQRRSKYSNKTLSL